MTRITGNPRADFEEWKVELVRLTTFYQPGTLSDLMQPMSWWRGVTGVDPVNRSEQIRSKELTDAGPLGDGWLLMKVQPLDSRVDWLLVDSMESQAPPGSVPLVERLAQFIDPLARWLAECPAPNRIAFGAVVGLPVADRASGYLRVCDYLNFDIDPEEASDFAYQINRPRPSMVMPELRINRLSRWSVGGLIRFVVSPSSQGPTMMNSDPSGHHVRLEVDINTPHRQEPFSQEMIPRLFEELVGLAREIICEGDI